MGPGGAFPWPSPNTGHGFTTVRDQELGDGYDELGPPQCHIPTMFSLFPIAPLSRRLGLLCRPRALTPYRVGPRPSHVAAAEGSHAPDATPPHPHGISPCHSLSCGISCAPAVWPAVWSVVANNLPPRAPQCRRRGPYPSSKLRAYYLSLKKLRC